VNGRLAARSGSFSSQIKCTSRFWKAFSNQKNVASLNDPLFMRRPSAIAIPWVNSGCGRRKRSGSRKGGRRGDDGERRRGPIVVFWLTRYTRSLYCGSSVSA